jgi:ABC-type transporter Mla maintaining outer membrane lipid asymmetry permease subunit MlaE
MDVRLLAAAAYTLSAAAWLAPQAVWAVCRPRVAAAVCVLMAALFILLALVHGLLGGCMGAWAVDTAKGQVRFAGRLQGTGRGREPCSPVVPEE